MIKYHEASASQSCFLIIHCITGFNIFFTIQQQATKICHKLYHKNVFEMKSLLVDTKSVSDFFNEKRVTEDKSMFGVAALLVYKSD